MLTFLVKLWEIKLTQYIKKYDESLVIFIDNNNMYQNHINELIMDNCEIINYHFNTILKLTNL